LWVGFSRWEKSVGTSLRELETQDLIHHSVGEHGGKARVNLLPGVKRDKSKKFEKKSMTEKWDRLPPFGENSFGGQKGGLGLIFWESIVDGCGKKGLKRTIQKKWGGRGKDRQNGDK